MTNFPHMDILRLAKEMATHEAYRKGHGRTDTCPEFFQDKIRFYTEILEGWEEFEKKLDNC